MASLTLEQMNDEGEMDNEIRGAWNRLKISARREEEAGNESDPSQFAKVVKCPAAHAEEHTV